MYITGDKYEGEWRNDYANGQGKLTLVTGLVYEGDWQDSRVRHCAIILTLDDQFINFLDSSMAKARSGILTAPNTSECSLQVRVMEEVK